MQRLLDILFSGLVANVIIEQSSERALFNRGGGIATPDTSARITDADLPGAFAKLCAALKPLVGGNLARVIVGDDEAGPSGGRDVVEEPLEEEKLCGVGVQV